MSKDKVKKFGDLAYEYIRKKLIKPGKGGITSLPTEKEITSEMLQMFEKLRGAGYNVTNIGKEVKNADDLGFLINRINQAEINQAKEFSDAAEALETIQFKLNNDIPLNPDDQKKLLGKGFKTATEAFQGFKPKVIQGGKKTKETDPDKKAEGGRIGYLRGGISSLLKSLQSKVGKKNITTADKIARPETALNREMFGEFNERMNRKILDVEETPPGFKLSRERLLKNFPEIDESMADEIMTLDRDLQLRVIAMLKDRRKNPEAYDKLLMEMGDTLDFQGEFDRSVQRSKNAEGGIMRLGYEKGGMTRRTFLKLLGGLASIPLVGKFLKPAAKVAKTADVAKTGGVPAYFPKLVEKIKLLGDDVTVDLSTKERQRVTKYKGYQLTEDIDTGKKEIKLGDAEYGSEEYMIYEPPETIIGKNNKPVEVPAQYDEVTVRPDYEGKMKDVEDGLDSYDEVIREVGEIKIKKSGGGLAYMLGE
jgi:hypothetical protein